MTPTMSRPHASVHAHLLPHVPVRLTCLPAAVPVELVVVSGTAPVHPAAVNAPAAHPGRLTVKPAASPRGIGIHRMGRKLDALVTAPHSDRLLFDRPPGLQILVPSVNHHFPRVRIGQEFRVGVSAFDGHHVTTARTCRGGLLRSLRASSNGEQPCQNHAGYKCLHGRYLQFGFVGKSSRLALSAHHFR